VAVRRCRNCRCIRNCGHRNTEGLTPGGSLSVGGEYTRVRHIIRVAYCVGSIDGVVISESIVGAANFIVDVVAQIGCIGVSRIAHFQAEHATTDEINPFNNLSVGLGLGLFRMERGIKGTSILSVTISEDDTTKGVSLFVSTVGVELTALVASGKANLSLIKESNDLNVIFGIEELDTSDSTGRDDTGAMARLSAPGHFTRLTLTNGIIGFTATPHTEVGNVVNKHGLTERVGTFSGAVAQIVTKLRATDTTVVTGDLVGDVRICEVLGGKGFEGSRSGGLRTDEGKRRGCK